MSEADKIATDWKLSDKEKRQLLVQRDKLNLAVSIHDSLHRIFEGDGERANAWIRKPNSAFNGESALDVMLKGRLDEVQKYTKYKAYFAQQVLW